MTSRRRLRSLRSARAAAAILAVVAATLLAPATAQADLLDVTCAPTSSTVTYDPPLTRTPQPVTVGATVLYGPCVSATVPGLTSGVTIASFPHPDHSCEDLLSPITTVSTITWNTGQTSTVTANTTATLVGGLLVVTHTGTVTAGLFHGDTVVRASAEPATDILLCLAGLATVSAVTLVGDLTITSIGGDGGWCQPHQATTR